MNRTHYGGKNMKGYCMKHKKMMEISSAKATRMKNGRKATKGKCASCGTTIFRIGG